MRIRKALPFLVLLLALAVAGCAQAMATKEAMMDQPTEAMMDQPTEAMMDKPTEAMMEDKGDMMATETPDAMMDKPTEAMMDGEDDMMPTETPEAMMEEDQGMMAPAWFSVSLTDVRNGESFTVADLKGKVVLVENMAQWCSTCFSQQNQVVELVEQLGERDDFVILGLDIDPNEDAVTLKDYIEKNGFTWRYAVSPAEVSREIGNLYGNQFLNPPSAPMFIIDRKGEVHLLPFGIKSADDLLKALEPFLAEGM